VNIFGNIKFGDLVHNLSPSYIKLFVYKC